MTRQLQYRSAAYGRLTFVVTDAEGLPDPAREVLDEPHLDAEDLQREIGDSEPWDEASVGDAPKE
jgi:hypothetical protein